MERKTPAVQIVAVLCLLAACKSEQPKFVLTETSQKTAFELPREADHVAEQILPRAGYTVSYNKETRCPNWVAWHLTEEHIDGPYVRKKSPYLDGNGNVAGIKGVTKQTRRGHYFEDTEAKGPRQRIADWKGVPRNITHGHMCPAGDSKWCAEAMNQSFLLTNMCPQTQKLNNGSWQRLEKRCRDWAVRYGDVYVVAGPVFRSEKGHRTMGQSKVAVPDAFFKVVLCTSGNCKAIGFVFENNDTPQSVNKSVCTVDEVERYSAHHKSRLAIACCRVRLRLVNYDCKKAEKTKKRKKARLKGDAF